MGNCWGVEVGLVSSDGNPNDSHTQNGNLCTSSRRVSYAVPTTPLRTEGEILQSTKGKRFTYTELKNATRNFRPDSVLGEGGFGSVFKGWIDEKSLTPTKPGTGMIIAVKRLKHESLQGHAEWLAEINYLEQFHHPHLVRLIGYCLEDEHRLLVYEFMSRGSLENHLFRRNSYFQPLSWNIRMKIALEAAKGLAYLHSPEVKIIYRDFKTSNVLLDSNYTAKISDFGLARDGPAGDQSHVSTRVMGTYGYAAPEYLATGHLTAKSDVYSFGVVLLELLSGRKTIDKNQPTRAHNLIEWAKPLLGNKRRFHQILDSRLEGQYSMSIAYNVASLAFECLSFEPKFRPSMDRVVTELEKLQNPREPTRRHRNERNVNNQVTNRTRDPSCPEARKRGIAHRGPLVRPFTPRDIQVEAH